MTKKNVEKTNEPVFTKETLVKSKRFKDNRDIVSALLEDGKEYSIAEVEGKITEYMKGKVK